jgi:AraC family transcriptional regulator
MDYVEAHIAEDLTLEKLAAVAAFSPFHFHRVFAAITGETLSDFIRRIRLERAASGLVTLRETSVLGIALRCGFSSAATFARSFRMTEKTSSWFQANQSRSRAPAARRGSGAWPAPARRRDARPA